VYAFVLPVERSLQLRSIECMICAYAINHMVSILDYLYILFSKHPSVPFEKRTHSLFHRSCFKIKL
jgi:hypothetical protein